MRILITTVVFLLACGALNAQEVEVELKRMRGWYAGGGLALADTGVSEKVPGSGSANIPTETNKRITR